MTKRGHLSNRDDQLTRIFAEALELIPRDREEFLRQAIEATQDLANLS